MSFSLRQIGINTGGACRRSEQTMANGVLQSLFREPKSQPTDRVIFAQTVSRISSMRTKKQEYATKQAECERKA